MPGYIITLFQMKLSKLLGRKTYELPTESTYYGEASGVGISRDMVIQNDIVIWLMIL